MANEAIKNDWHTIEPNILTIFFIADKKNAHELLFIANIKAR